MAGTRLAITFTHVEGGPLESRGASVGLTAPAWEITSLARLHAKSNPSSTEVVEISLSWVFSACSVLSPPAVSGVGRSSRIDGLAR
jgi:hypothetical protein